MLYLIFMDKTEEEAAELTNRKVIDNPDARFNYYTKGVDLNKDEFFVKALREIDRCDIPMDNVARDLLTGRTHSFDKVSTGLRSLWLMYHKPDAFVYLASFFGENCYRLLLEISKTRDIIVYDDVEMLSEDILEGQEIEFINYTKQQHVKTTYPECDDYYMNEVYEE